MNYEVRIDASRQLLVMMDMSRLDGLYEDAKRRVKSPRIEEAAVGTGILYAMSRLGLLDGNLEPDWR